jgi:hypothetical protein
MHDAIVAIVTRGGEMVSINKSHGRRWTAVALQMQHFPVRPDIHYAQFSGCRRPRDLTAV